MKFTLLLVGAAFTNNVASLSVPSKPPVDGCQAPSISRPLPKTPMSVPMPHLPAGEEPVSREILTRKDVYKWHGYKAGLSGYPGINLYQTDVMNAFAPYIGWYSDYTPNTPNYKWVKGIPMLWGDGNSCVSSTNITQRVKDFYASTAHHTPEIMFGFYEPDCDCPMSSDMSNPVYGAHKWNQMLAPLAKKGTVLGSPPTCKQSAEDWLTPFKNAGLDADWQVTSIHINVATLAAAKKDVEHYVNTYGKPVWVSEFACVHAGNGFFNPCTNQEEIDNFINAVVPYFHDNPHVVAYGASNGEGLGNVWPLTKNGQLSHTGKTYLKALKALHKNDTWK